MFSSAKFEPFKSAFQIPTDKDNRPFDLDLPVQRGWASAKNRVLIVVGHVSTDDLRAKKLFSDSTIITNVLKLARTYAATVGAQPKSYAYAAINFGHYRHYHLKGDALSHALSSFVRRVRLYIDKVQPTAIIIIGDEVATALLPDVPELLKKRGWVHKLTAIPTITTIDFNNAHAQDSDDDEEYEDEEELDRANLLGYAARNLAAVYTGHLLYRVSPITINPLYVDTIPKFKRMMEILNEAPAIACDTETENLSTLKNRLLFIQFATSTKRGWCLPLHHAQTPFNSKQLAYIWSELRAFFAQKPESGRYLIGQNFGFDLRQIRHQFRIPFVYWPVFDLMAGLFCLDENIKMLQKYGTPQYGLAQQLCSAGNDFYYTARFSKSDRLNIELYAPDDKDVLAYTAMDVQCAFALHNLYLKIASYQKLGSVSFGKAYLRFVTNQMSNVVHLTSMMEANGALLDLNYIFHLRSPKSPLRLKAKELEQELMNTKAAVKANKLLLQQSGIPVRGLFGATKIVLKLSKPDHKKLLFLDVLGLEPVNTSTKTGEASIDKEFQKAHKDVKEIQLFTEKSKIDKLLSTYVKGFASKLAADPDSMIDKCLRPGYAFAPVVTGRINSFDPSLHQVPTRSAEAKYIKRMFIAPINCLILKADYSAHEVRMWSVLSGDMQLADKFRVGRDLRRKLYYGTMGKWASDCKQLAKGAIIEVKKEIDLKGDIHRVNYSGFTGVPVTEVTDEQRGDSKGITFGNIYGMAVRTLAAKLKKPLEDVQKLVDKFFAAAPKAGKWLNQAVKCSEENLYSASILGRKRNLFGYLMGVNRVSAALGRRAKNSPVQGVGADVAHTGIITYVRLMYEVLLRMKRIDPESGETPYKVRTAVHDSCFSHVDFKNLIVGIHMMHHSLTEGTVAWYQRVFGVTFTVQPEIELEIGADESRLYKWDWSYESLIEIVDKALIDYQEIHGEIDVEATKEIIFKDLNNVRLGRYLHDRYPVFNK